MVLATANKAEQRTTAKGKKGFFTKQSWKMWEIAEGS